MLRTLLIACAIFATTGSTSQAAIQISLDNVGNSNVNLGADGPNKIIDFYISETAGSNDAVFGAVLQYSLQGGAISDPPGRIGAKGSDATGFFGAGNLSTSEFRFDATNLFGINQEFTDGMQPLGDTPELWFSLDIDTTGLAEGEYTISLADPTGSFFDSTGFAFIPANNNLSFSVTAVPEPSSLAALSALGGLAILIRRRRRSL